MSRHPLPNGRTTHTAYVDRTAGEVRIVTALGVSILVDLADYERLQMESLHISTSRGYPCVYSGRSDSNYNTPVRTALAALITDSKYVRFQNGNPLDCRTKNLNWDKPEPIEDN